MKTNSKKKIILISVMFIAIGFFVFLVGSVNKYDSKTQAFRIGSYEYRDSDGKTYTYPEFYYEVKGIEYKCRG